MLEQLGGPAAALHYIQTRLSHLARTPWWAEVAVLIKNTAAEKGNP